MCRDGDDGGKGDDEAAGRAERRVGPQTVRWVPPSRP